MNRQMNDLARTTFDIFTYIFGSLAIAFGVVWIIRSDLGTSPWDTLYVAIGTVTPLTVGTAAIVVTLIITAFIILVRRKLRYFFMAVPIILVGVFIDLFNLVVFSGFEPEGTMRLAVFLVGLLIIPMGGALLVLSRYPAGVLEELMLLLMKLFKTKNLIRVRLFMEATPALLGVLLTGVFKGHIGSLYFGTVVLVLLAGPLFRLYLSLFRRIEESWKSPV